MYVHRLESHGVMVGCCCVVAACGPVAPVSCVEHVVTRSVCVLPQLLLLTQVLGAGGETFGQVRALRSVAFPFPGGS